MSSHLMGAWELEANLAQKRCVRRSSQLWGSFREERGKAGTLLAAWPWMWGGGLSLPLWHGRALFHQGSGENFCWGHKRARWSGAVW